MPSASSFVVFGELVSDVPFPKQFSGADPGSDWRSSLHQRPASVMSLKQSKHILLDDVLEQLKSSSAFICREMNEMTSRGHGN